MHSKENFEIKLRVKKKDGKIVDLQKKFDLEVKWEMGKGRVALPKKVVFEKDGESFQIIITRLDIQRGLLKKSQASFNWKVPPNASYQIYHGEPNPSPEAKLSTAKDENDYYIKFTNPWRIEIIVPLSIAVIVVVFIIIIFLGIRKKEEK